MVSPVAIDTCPGTLATGFQTYSSASLRKVFNGRKVSHVLDYNSPLSDAESGRIFDANRRHISISGVQEKFSVLQVKNKLRLARANEKSTHILKPIPLVGNRKDQMPANEHLTMQIAGQVFKIETAANALIFFKDGTPAYITKRFDRNVAGGKIAQEDFASLLQRTPQTHGEHYKYSANYLELFDFMRSHLPAYKVEALKLYKILIFNYLFSNGDAHLKNFSILETDLGDFTLSPSYDLLNSKIHINDEDFALEDGLLPKAINHGTVAKKFTVLAEKAGIKERLANQILGFMTSKNDQVQKLVEASYLNEKTKRSYIQYFQRKMNRLVK